jgi:hypothetical protein
MLGGARLYGDNPTAPIRELLQNAMDAIQARRALQDRIDWGLIKVELKKIAGDTWLSVEDNGVGMSERVLAGTLLDFGSSLWRSVNVIEEFPTLAARGMHALGRFGIGFFSVFILGDEVRVTTRRYDKGEASALILSFLGGLWSRPILATPSPQSVPLDGGTRVEIRLRRDPQSKGAIRFSETDSNRDFSGLFSGPRRDFSSLADLVGYLAPASTVSIDAVQAGRVQRVVEANDWLTIPAKVLGQRVGSRMRLVARDYKVEVGEVEKIMRPIVGSDGITYGRAAIWPTDYDFDAAGVLTAGGLRVKWLPDFFGLVSGEVETAARDQGRVVVAAAALREWATEQARLVSTLSIHEGWKARAAEVVAHLGGDVADLPLVRRGLNRFNVQQLRAVIIGSRELPVHVGDISYEDYDPVGKDMFDRDFKSSDEVLFIPENKKNRGSPLKVIITQLIEELWDSCEISKTKITWLVVHGARKSLGLLIYIFDPRPKLDLPQSRRQTRGRQNVVIENSQKTTQIPSLRGTSYP